MEIHWSDITSIGNMLIHYFKNEDIKYFKERILTVPPIVKVWEGIKCTIVNNTDYPYDWRIHVKEGQVTENEAELT